MGKFGYQKNTKLQNFLKEHKEVSCSNGQHKTSIAKALVHNSSILVFDQAKECKNPKIEFEVEELILNMREMTVLSVHRQMTIALIEKYDKIFLLDQESQVEEGTFNELLQHNPYFYNLYISNET